MRAVGFWENVKPSRLGPNKPKWMDFDDEWVWSTGLFSNLLGLTVFTG
jgi:hypothetical protein